MASPPSKRIRRTVVVSSDDEDSTADSQLSTSSLNITTQGLSLKKDLQTQDSRQGKAAKPKLKVARKTKTTKGKKNASNGSAITKNASIYSFFNNATQSSSQNTVRPKSPPREETALTPQDAIDDISSDGADSNISLPISQKRKIDGVPTKKIDGGTVEPSAVSKRKQFSTASGSNVSLNDTLQGKNVSDTWADLYAPDNLSELVVHSRKVADVHKWLDNVVKSRERKRLLVLKGPSGSGKTATLRLLVREVGLRIVEWENPVGASFEEEGFISLATQFDEFLTRTINFNGLELHDNHSMTSTATQSEPGMLVLIEDFPNTFARGSLALMNFRDSVLRYLVASIPPPGTRASDSRSTPIVMIVSETHVSGSTDHSDSFTVGKLLGPQLLQHPGVSVIEFNPVAPGLLSKAITTAVRKNNTLSVAKWSPSADLIKEISQSGDIRSSINSLQLARLFEQGQSSNSSYTQSNAQKTSKKRSLPRTEQTSSSVNFRDNIIDLFHAVGKILYNKRKDADSEIVIQPPAYLRHHFRPRVSEVSIEILYNNIASDINTFTLTLHENYPLSCYGEDFADSLDDSITQLSDADLLLSSGNDSLSLQTLGRHPSSVILTEYAFQIASRGLIFTLPYPVERGKTMSSLLKPGRDPFKMVYPAALRLWRTIDENETILDDWNDALLKGEDTDACKRISRTDMVTQLLPYLSKINPDLETADSKGRKTRSGYSAIEKEDEMDTSGIPLVSSLALPLPVTSSVNEGRNSAYIGGRTTLLAKYEQLVLSDDDIEDD